MGMESGKSRGRKGLPAGPARVAPKEKKRKNVVTVSRSDDKSP